MQEKCLKMQSLTTELLFYTRDCLKISLKNSYNLPENGYIFCHLYKIHVSDQLDKQCSSEMYIMYISLLLSLISI